MTDLMSYDISEVKGHDHSVACRVSGTHADFQSHEETLSAEPKVSKGSVLGGAEPRKDEFRTKRNTNLTPDYVGQGVCLETQNSVPQVKQRREPEVSHDRVTGRGTLVDSVPLPTVTELPGVDPERDKYKQMWFPSLSEPWERKDKCK